MRHRIPLLRSTARDREKTAILIDDDDVIVFVESPHAHDGDSAEKKAKDKRPFFPHTLPAPMAAEKIHLNWQPLGDSALITECDHPAAFAQQLRENCPTFCHDAVSSYRHLAIYFAPADFSEIERWLTNFSFTENSTEARLHHLPVWYDPEWIEELSAKLKKTPEEIIELHSSTEFTVAALGFSPGFPYLTGLPPELQLPRKDTPARLPAGTVAIAADQAGIYPNDSFGGWHPLGLTGASLFNPHENPHTLFEPGDHIRFESLENPPAITLEDSAEPIGHEIAIVESSGPATSIQSSSRLGHRHLGITPGGSSDSEMRAALNLLLGNPPEAPILEFALEAPILRFLATTKIAFLGPHHPQAGRIVEVKKGTLLDLKNHPMQSAFGSLAISGGFAVPEILGSTSTDLRGNFGGQVLEKNSPLFHHLESAEASQPSHIRWPLLSSDTLTIRTLPGEQASWFSNDLTESSFQKTARFDRTAARLSGTPLSQTITKELTSRPVLAGAIQVPPDGIPTVLLPECQTIGGYPVIAHVITADLPALTRAKPGTQIHFQTVTLPEAHRAFEIAQRELAIFRTGLNL